MSSNSIESQMAQKNVGWALTSKNSKSDGLYSLCGNICVWDASMLRSLLQPVVPQDPAVEQLSDGRLWHRFVGRHFGSLKNTSNNHQVLLSHLWPTYCQLFRHIFKSPLATKWPIWSTFCKLQLLLWWLTYESECLERDDTETTILSQRLCPLVLFFFYFVHSKRAHDLNKSNEINGKLRSQKCSFKVAICVPICRL